MSTLKTFLFSLFLVAMSSTALAQRTTTIGFETDCNGAPTPGTFIGGLKQVSGSLYATCGIASIASGGASGQQQLAQSGAIPVIGNIKDVTGSAALAGAFDFAAILSSSFAEVIVVFSPPVNAVSFDALDLDRADGLTVTLAGPQGVPLPPVDNPSASGKTVRYQRTSSTPIERITIAYRPLNIPLVGDGWFLDQLSFNAYVCGDGEVEPGEACDDGNRVQCDSCNNNCQPSTAGCFNGSICIANGTSAGCLQCALPSADPLTADVAPTPVAVGTTCDDNLFCTLPGTCDAAGICQSPINNCSDGVVCTVDSCDEVNNVCLHPIEDKWCLIGGVCVPNGNANPTNFCQLCASSTSNSSWGAREVGAQCGDPVCNAGAETAAPSCAAGGSCVAPAPTMCMFAQCANAQSCDGLCTGDQNCNQQAHCDAASKMCVPDLTPGTACMRNTQCASNFCVDGVCCDKSCNGVCESCNQAGKVGMCLPLPAMAIDPQALCAANQFCSADGKCTSPPPVMPPPVIPPVVTPPGEARPMGTGCDRNEVCGSGICKDGVCCDRACEGLCESCNVPGQTIGQCLPFALGQDPEAECGGAGSVCNGESACTSYETRGNGLCSVAPIMQASTHAGPGSRGGATALASLLTLGLGLAWRRRGARASRRKRT